MMRNKAALGGLVAVAAMVIAGACTNDFDFYSFTDSLGGGGTGGGTTSTSSGGGGGTGPSCDPAACPGSDTDCAKRACDANDQCVVNNEASGTSCTDANNQAAKVCDGQGVCVECNDASDCTGTDICDQNQCVPITCSDNTQNGSETDVDCGGQDCAPCDNGKICIEAGDCTSGFCEGSGGGGGGGGSATGTCAPCVTETDCQTDNWCDGGLCKPQGNPGDSCGSDVECKSGHCPGDDGVCCDTACGALCAACQASKTGGTDGTCAPVTAGSDPDTECTQSQAQCNTGQCSGTAGKCEAAPGSVTCRPQAGGCDIEETCTGTSTGCPADDVQNNGHVCRAQNGVCDVAEVCNGSSKNCPIDGVVPANPPTLCRPVSLPANCDVAESCDGNNKDCPPDGFIPDGQPSNGGTCDPYLCDGTQAGCPSSCVGDGDCVSPNTCPSSLCCLASGEACGASAECCSNSCSGTCA